MHQYLRLLPVFLLFLLSAVRAQQAPEFGVLTAEEKAYLPRTSEAGAHALVLYERGDNYFEVLGNRIWLIKKYHVKIRVLDEEGFKEGTVVLPYYHGDESSEKIENIRAVTHNGTLKTFVPASQVYTNDVNDRVSEKKFTFSAIQAGSVLEYEYKLISPFIFTFNGWSFQSHLPKRYSEFNATIPGNYSYNRNLSGGLPLEVNDAKLVRECFKIEGTLRAADCEVLKYAMKDIPAFREEDYMLASSNYISRIDFELAEHRRLDGVTDRYTKSWADVDREFKNDRDLGIQLTKKGFFEKQVPESLLVDGDPLTRAKNIYEFIRNHFTWNGQYGIYRDIRVKEAFDRQQGNIGEINISLINLLHAAGIPTQMMLLSTRAHGLPKRSHPVMTDFNYLVARVSINGTVYLLDASEKLNPFGMLPFRCLNYYGRVMDFKNDSYWEDIRVEENNRHTIRVQLGFDPMAVSAKGILDEITMGYEAVSRREELREKKEDAYLEAMENSMAGDYNIHSYMLNTQASDETRVSERFEFEAAYSLVNDVLYFKPFLLPFFEQNPFLTEMRQFPVDFGFPRSYSYTLSVQVPEAYQVEQLPENITLALPDNLGRLKFETAQTGRNISLFFTLVLNGAHIPPLHYPALKDLFSKSIALQQNTLIVLKPKP